VTTRLLAKIRNGAVSSISAEGVPPRDRRQRSGRRPALRSAGATHGVGKSPQAIADETIRELGRATRSPSYAISQPVVADEHFSGVGANLRVTPVSFFGAQGTIVYAVEDPRLSFATAGINLTDPRPVAGPDDTFLTALRPVNSLSIPTNLPAPASSTPRCCPRRRRPARSRTQHRGYPTGSPTTLACVPRDATT
jgi:hypothetical protein